MHGEHDGFFWHPDRPDKRIRGRLRWTRSNGGDLVLEDALSPNGDVAGAKAAVLFGKSLEGEPFVLLDTFVYHFSATSRITQRWLVNRAFIGTEDPSPRISQATLELEGLHAFCGDSALSVRSGREPDEPVEIRWIPKPEPVEVAVGIGKAKLVPRHSLDVSDVRASVTHSVSLVVHPAEAVEYRVATRMLVRMAALLAFFADRQFTVVKEFWQDTDGYEVEYRYQPIIGVTPRRPNRVWLHLDDVRPRLQTATTRWLELIDTNGEMIDLIVEEVHFSRRTNTTERVLRLSRILELMHRVRHPDVVSAPSDEDVRIDSVLSEVSGSNRRWLAGRLEQGRVRLRQRLGELIADLNGSLDATLIDCEAFAKLVTKTRNWHTHYSDDKGIATGVDVHRLSQRLWLLVRASLLLDLGWPAEEVEELIRQDPYTEWLTRFPLVTS